MPPIDLISIGHDIVGGNAIQSGYIYGNVGVGQITVGGSVVGGNVSERAGAIVVDHLGTLKIGHDLRGGLGRESAEILSSKITSISIGGSVFGGRGNMSGYISASGSLGSVTIAGDLRGGR